MTFSIANIPAKDGTGATIASGVEFVDTSGLGTGPYIIGKAIIDPAGVNVAKVSAGGALLVDGTATTQPTGGNVAAGATDSGNPVKVGGVFNTALPTLTTGQRGDLQLGSRGSARMEIFDPSGTLGARVFAPVDNAGVQNSLFTSSQNLLFNGTNFDRARNNVDTASLITLTAAAAGTTNSTDQTNYNGRGVQLVVDITAATTMTLTVKIQGKDIASGKYYDILTSAAFAAVGTNVLTVYPGAAVTANVSNGQPLPRTWRAQAIVTGTSVTATVGASVIL